MRRVSDPALFGRPIVVTNGHYRFLVAEQLAAIGMRGGYPARAGPARFRAGHCRRRRLRAATRRRSGGRRARRRPRRDRSAAFAKVCATAGEPRKTIKS